MSFVDVFQKTVFYGIFAVFCGVLRCFVCVFLAFFFKQHKTDQKIYKTNKTNKIQNTLCAIQRNTVLCVFLSLRKCLQKKSKTRPKHCKTSAKHCKTLFFKKHSQNTTNHPQNTAKHHKTHLLTKQTELANKPLRSRDLASSRALLICPTPVRCAAQRACAARAAQSLHTPELAPTSAAALAIGMRRTPPGWRTPRPKTKRKGGGAVQSAECPLCETPARQARLGQRVERQQCGAHVWHTVLSHWAAAPWARGVNPPPAARGSSTAARPSTSCPTCRTSISSSTPTRSSRCASPISNISQLLL